MTDPGDLIGDHKEACKQTPYVDPPGGQRGQVGRIGELHQEGGGDDRHPLGRNGKRSCGDRVGERRHMGRVGERGRVSARAVGGRALESIRTWGAWESVGRCGGSGNVDERGA